MISPAAQPMFTHDHVFLGADHERNERRAWLVIALCLAMMVGEIAGGVLFGSIALVADGLHMSTHAGALLLAALAYRYARRHAMDRRFTFGTGKLGDLAGYTSAVILAMIALLIAYEAVDRLLHPVAIDYAEAIGIAVLGLGVNLASFWLLSGGHHHGHHHAHAYHQQESRFFNTPGGGVRLSIFEEGVPPRFRLHGVGGGAIDPQGVAVEIVRPDGERQRFTMVPHDSYLESSEEIPEPHEFGVRLTLPDGKHEAVFAEHSHVGDHHHDNNFRATVMHVLADAAVSVLVIVGLVLGRFLGWIWMDALAGLVGAGVIVSWSYTLIRDTGGILMDVLPDAGMAEAMRATLEEGGDRVADLHLWRLGPGHMGAIVSVATEHPHDPRYYRQRLLSFPTLSHVTVEVQPLGKVS